LHHFERCPLDRLQEATHANLVAPVQKLLAVAKPAAANMVTLRFWTISSTERGGGVAEMMPRFLIALREFGVAGAYRPPHTRSGDLIS